MAVTVCDFRSQCIYTHGVVPSSRDDPLSLSKNRLVTFGRSILISFIR